MNDSARQMERLRTERPARLILSLSLPATLSLLISAGCGILDAWLISRLGTAASGAAGIAFSILSLIQAVGYTLGTGAGSQISRALGADDRQNADFAATTAFTLALLLGGAIAGIGLLFAEPIVRLLGASNSIAPYAKAYAYLLFPAAPILCGEFVLNNALRAEGRVGYAMLATVSGNLLNAALDAFLMPGLKLGITGAALALLLSQSVSLVLLLIPYLRKRTKASLRLSHIKKPGRRLLALLAIGSPSLLRQGLAGVSSALLLRQARKWGDAAAAAVSVNARIFLLLYSICLGIGQGMMPAAGYNHGAKDPLRVLKLFRFSLVLATALMLLLSIPTAVLSPRLIALFRTDTEVVRIGSLMLRAQCTVLCLHGIIAVTNMLLQALGMAVPAALIAAARQGICFLPVFLLLPYRFGEVGLCWVQASADLLTFLLTLPYLLRILHQLKSDKKAVRHPL